MHRNSHCHTFMKSFEANMDGRDFIVGDLHGCYDELQMLLKHVKFDTKQDRLFSTGDLMDRGPKSLDCVTLLNQPWFHPVLGNHEDLILGKLETMEEFQNVPESEIAEEFQLNAEEKAYLKGFKPYRNKLLDIPLVIEIEHMLYNKIYIVHAEVLPEHLNRFSNQEQKDDYLKYYNAMQRFDFTPKVADFFKKYKGDLIDYSLKQKLLWSRKNITGFYSRFEKEITTGDFDTINKNRVDTSVKIYCGHNIVPFPMKIGLQYYIDTGAALGHTKKDNTLNIFSKFGSEFFSLTLVDITSGTCYCYVTSGPRKGKIMKLQGSLYESSSV